MDLLQAELNIANICGGAIPERFDREINAVLTNLADTNTGIGKRKIKIVVEIVPDKKRESFSIVCKMETTLAGAESVDGRGYLIRTKDGVKGVAHDPQQLTLMHEQPLETSRASATPIRG